MAERVLVTGAAGFIGSNFVRHLLRATDYEVVVVDKLTYAGSRENLPSPEATRDYRFVQGDIRDEATVEPEIEDADKVVNFAAQTHVDNSIDDSEPFVLTNVDGVRSLMDIAAESEVDKYVQISTDEVYGEIAEGAFTEEDALSPRNPYSATKAAADHLVESYYETHGLPAVIARPSNNFGPRQHREKLIPKFIELAAAGEPLPVYGDGSNVREWTYVYDTCAAIETLLRDGEPGEAYNIGSGNELSNVEVTEKIIGRTEASADLIEFVEDRPGHDQRYALDSSKMRSLGWEPEWSFDDGLAETVDHYL